MSAFGTPLTATGPATVPFAGIMGQPHPMSMCTPGQTPTAVTGGGLGPDLTPLPFPSHFKFVCTGGAMVEQVRLPDAPPPPSAPPLPYHVSIHAT